MQFQVMHDSHLPNTVVEIKAVSNLIDQRANNVMNRDNRTGSVCSKDIKWTEINKKAKQASKNSGLTLNKLLLYYTTDSWFGST